MKDKPPESGIVGGADVFQKDERREILKELFRIAYILGENQEEDEFIEKEVIDNALTELSKLEKEQQLGEEELMQVLKEASTFETTSEYSFAPSKLCFLPMEGMRKAIAQAILKAQREKR